jgi:hypothetical protein
MPIEFENQWKVHRKPGAKRVAIKHPQWQKPMYITPTDAADLVKQIAEVLGVEPPMIEMKAQCQATKRISLVDGGGGLIVRCEADAGVHMFGNHYWINDGVRITWREGA